MLKRLAAGNIAAMLTMLVNIAAQILVVPIFLHFWSANIYGVWLALVTTMSLVTLADVTHQDYIGFESMKLKHNDRLGRSALISDAIPVIFLTGIVQLLAITFIIKFGLLNSIFHINKENKFEIDSVSYSIIYLVILWVSYQNFSGILVRVLASLGYFATGAWWGLLNAVVVAVGPAIAAASGAGLVGAALVQVAATVIVNTFIYMHYYKILKIEGIVLTKPNLQSGLKRYLHSLILTSANIIEFLQQAGFRLIILPLIGTQRLVQFSTHRTIANVAQQGISTLINPTVPELMRFIVEKNSEKVSAVMFGMSYVTIVLICPGFVFLQLIVEYIFKMWTMGKVEFDPIAFASISGAVMILCLSQPSRAIIRGNNLVTSQALVSAIVGILLIILSFCLVRQYGVRGATYVLLVAETIRSALNISIATIWLKRARIQISSRITLISSILVLVTILSVFIMGYDRDIKFTTFFAYFIIWGLLNIAMWKAAPSGVREVVLNLFRKNRPKSVSI